MNELLQKLLEAEVLTDETKTELEEAFKSQLDEAITAAKEDAAADVRAELSQAHGHDLVAGAGDDDERPEEVIVRRHDAHDGQRDEYGSREWHTNAQ